MVCIDWDWRTKIRVTNWDARDHCIKKHAVCWKKKDLKIKHKMAMAAW